MSLYQSFMTVDCRTSDCPLCAIEKMLLLLDCPEGGAKTSETETKIFMRTLLLERLVAQ